MPRKASVVFRPTCTAGNECGGIVKLMEGEGGGGYAMHNAISHIANHGRV